MRFLDPTWAFAAALAAIGVAQSAKAQEAKHFFFEGDMVRGAQQGAPGPFCVLTSQFKHKKKSPGASAYSIRTASQSMTRGLRASWSNYPTARRSRPISAVIRQSRRRPITFGPPMDHPGRLSHRHLRLQGRCDRYPRPDADLGAVQDCGLPAHHPRGRRRNQKVSKAMAMMLGSVRRPLLIFACAVCVVALPQAATAAHPAGAFGPQVEQGEPSGGYVGRLDLTPDHGPAGTSVTVTAQGLPAGQEFEVVWRTVKGLWKVNLAEYFGREFEPVAYEIATVKPDETGRMKASFIAPEDFGFQHDIVVQQAGRLLHADRLQPRHDGEAHRSEQRSDRHADWHRGHRHRLARTRNSLGAPLRQQVHRLHVGRDDRRYCPIGPAGHRPRRPPSSKFNTRTSARPIATPSSRRCQIGRFYPTSRSRRATGDAAGGRLAGANAGALAAAEG